MQLKSLTYSKYKSTKFLFATILTCIFITGVFVRVYQFDKIPDGLNQDEASIGYEAYSILTSGADRNGYNYPIHFVSWGSGQNALYAYLTIPFVKVFGLNVFSVRIVNVLFSLLTLFIFYLIIKQHFKQNKFLLFAIFLFVINPWSIMSARWGLESNIFPAIILLSAFFIIKAYTKNHVFLPIAILFLAISLYAYGTAYFFVPFFILGIVFFVKPAISFKNVILISSIAIFIILSYPILKFILINHFDLPPSNNTIFSIPKLEANRTTTIFNLFSTQFFNEFIKNAARFTNIIFNQSDGNLYNSIPATGTIYHISVFFCFVGFFFYFSEKTSRTLISNIFMVWLIVAIIMAFTINSNINRLNIIFYPLIFFTSDGVYRLTNLLKINLKKPIFNSIILIYSILFAVFTGTYFDILLTKKEATFSKGIDKALVYANSIYHNDTIIVSNDYLNMPYIYISFYKKIPSEKFRNEIIYSKKSNSAFREVIGLGKYIFQSSNPQNTNVQIVKNTELVKFINTSYSIATFDDFSVIKVISMH